MAKTSSQAARDPASIAFETEHLADAGERQRNIEQLEDQITELAAHIHAATYRLVRLYRRAKRSEALEQENGRHALRELDWSFDEDGCWIFRGRFTPEQGAMIQKVLEQVMEEIYQQHKDVPAETSDDQNDDENPRATPVARRQADALLRIAQAYGSSTGNNGNSSDRYLVHIHTDMETLKTDGAGAEAELEDFGHVPAETCRRLACDAGVVHWLDDGDGVALNVGRKTRSIPPSIRRALQRRDGGCRFPGCTCSRFVDAHHIRHWADGGETSMKNLILLCRHHHRLVHEEGFGLQRTMDGDFRFTDPAGKQLPACAETRSRGNFLTLFSTHQASGIHITPETTQSEWLGERMDDQLAVEGLLDFE